MQAVGVRVPDDAADVIGEAEHLGHLERLRIEAVDDRFAVRPVLSNRHPEVLAVEVDAAGVVDVAFAQFNRILQFAIKVQPEHPAAPYARGAVVTILRRLVTLGTFDDLDGGEEQAVAHADHALRMMRVEVKQVIADQLSAAVLGELSEAVGQPVLGQGRAERGDAGDCEYGSADHAVHCCSP